jgi:phosphatidylglycerol---prolipoprotein diacylglyceryl transferase
LASLDGAHELIAEALYRGEPLDLVLTTGTTRSIDAITPPARSLPVHPAQVYSSITAGLLAWVLWSYYPLRRRDGQVTALMITLYPIARFFEEMIRVDEPSVFGTGLSISQNVSVILLLAAIGMWIWLARQPLRLAYPGGRPADA